MDKETTLRHLILQYINNCAEADPNNAEELSVAADCLRTSWGMDDRTVTIPGISSLLDLIPVAKNDTARGMELKLAGNKELSQGNYDKAIDLYTQAINADPTQATFYCNRAAALTKKNQFKEAIPDCEKAIQLDPKYAGAYSRLGFAYWSLNNIPEARKAYQRGLQACPDNQTLRENLESLPQEQQAPSQDFLSSMMGMLGQNPNIIGQLQERLQSPEVQRLAEDPEYADIFEKVSANPMSALSMMGDPRMMKLIQIIMGTSK